MHITQLTTQLSKQVKFIGDFRSEIMGVFEDTGTLGFAVAARSLLDRGITVFRRI